MVSIQIHFILFICMMVNIFFIRTNFVAYILYFLKYRIFFQPIKYINNHQLFVTIFVVLNLFLFAINRNEVMLIINSKIMQCCITFFFQLVYFHKSNIYVLEYSMDKFGAAFFVKSLKKSVKQYLYSLDQSNN